MSNYSKTLLQLIVITFLGEKMCISLNSQYDLFVSSHCHDLGAVDWILYNSKNIHIA